MAHLGSEERPNFRALSLFRIAFAIYLLWDYAANFVGYHDAFLGRAGIVPLSALSENRFFAGVALLAPLLSMLESMSFAAVLPFFYPIALLGILAGWQTRICTVAAFFANSFIYWRNPYIRSGAETLAHLLLLWSIFLPLNRYWAVDAALDAQPRERDYPWLPFLALRMQISSLYIFAALFKLLGEPWRDGSAVAFAMNDNVFGQTLLSQAVLSHASGILPLVNFAVIGLQMLFPLIVYAPWRSDLLHALALAGAAAMHIAFIFFLNIGGFPYLCLVMLILLVPDDWIERVQLEARQRQSRIILFHEDGCTFCRKTALLIREFLLSPASRVEPASSNSTADALLREHRSWVVRTADDAMLLKWEGMAYVLRQHPLLQWLGWLTDRKGTAPAFEHAYDWVGRNRRWLGHVTRLALPYRRERGPGVMMQTVCGVLMVLAFIGNCRSLREHGREPSALANAIAFAQVGQMWSLFAPNPTSSRWDFRMVLHQQWGASNLDIVLPRPPISPTANGSVEFANHRWLKFFTAFEIFEPQVWTAFGTYLCKTARAVFGEGSGELTIDFVFSRSDANADTVVREMSYKCGGPTADEIA